MPDQYLSTDPNAGDPVVGGAVPSGAPASGGYLSMDPNAGQGAVGAPDQGGDVLLDNISNVAGQAKDLAVGFGKKIVETGIRGGALLRKIPGVDALANALPSTDVNYTPSNTTQKVGGMLEQAAEVAAPARGLMALGEKAAVAATPRLAPVVGETMARILPRAAVEGAGSAGLATAQGASPNEALASGVLGAAAPTIGEAAISIANKLRGKGIGPLGGATENVEQFFSPTTKAMKGIVAKRTNEILDRSDETLGALGKSREGAVEAYTAARQQAGDAIDEALKTFGSDTVKDAPQRLMAALDSAKQPYVKNRVVSAAEAAAMPKKYTVGPMPNGQVQVAIPLNGTKVDQIEGLKTIIEAHGDDMTVDDLVGVRRAWDEIAYAKPGLGDNVKTDAQKWAKKMGGDSIRAIIESDKPELSALNREFSFWKDIETVMTATELRKRGQVGGLLPGNAEAAGRVVGAVTSGTLGAAVVVGKSAKMLQQMFQSPRWNSLAANFKTGIADAIESGNQQATATWIRNAATRIGAIEAPRDINLSISGSISDAATP